MNKEKKALGEQLVEITSDLFAKCGEKEHRHAAKYGVSSVEFRCIRVLLYHQVLTVNQLAKKMSLSSSRVTRIVDGLVDKKYVLRDPDPVDRRIFNISLSKDGKAIGQNLVKSYRKIHNGILSQIPEQDREKMIQMLKALDTAITRWLENE